MIRVRHKFDPNIWSGKSKFFGGGGGPPPPPPSPEVAQYTARLSTPLSPPVAAIVATLIDGLVAAGLWNVYDIIRCPFLPMVEADALINLKTGAAPGNAASAVNAPAWAEKVGYTFNGTNQYIDEGYAPSSGGLNYQVNSGCWGLDIRAYTSAADANLRSGSQSDSSGNNQLCVFPRVSANNMTGRISNNVLVGTGSFGASGVGLFTINRSTSTAAQVYRNGVVGMTSGNLSSGSSTRPLYIGAYNNQGTAQNFHAATYASWFMTNSKTAGQQLTIYNAFNQAYTDRQAT